MAIILNDFTFLCNCPPRLAGPMGPQAGISLPFSG